MRSRLCLLALVALMATPCDAQGPMPPEGKLLLCGGGKLGQELLDAFFALGGGERGRLVLIPTASPRSDQGDYSPWLPVWKQYSWQDLQVVHVINRSDADNPAHAELLHRASAIWIGGGDQARLSDRLAGTPIERELHAFLGRGGVLGGTSAGAAICSKVMIREGSREPILCRDGVLEVLGVGRVHWYRAGEPQASISHQADACWHAGFRLDWSQVVAPIGCHDPQNR